MIGISMPPKHLSGKKQVVVLLDPDDHKAFKIETAKRGETMQEVLHRFITDYAADSVKAVRRERKKSGSHE